MADNDKKRFYWLKLKKDFFHQHQIKVLKSLPNGRLYALIYLELLAESTSHDGELRYSQMLPYDIVTLSAVIDEDKDNVEKAIETCINLELIEILDDGTIYMREIQKLIGSETGKAERMRDYRERKKISNATLWQKCSLENRDKSIEYREKIDDDNKNIMDDLELLNQRYIESGIAHKVVAQAMGYFVKYDIKSKEFYRKIIDVLNDDEIYNKEAYISEIARNL